MLKLLPLIKSFVAFRRSSLSFLRTSATGTFSHFANSAFRLVWYIFGHYVQKCWKSQKMFVVDGKCIVFANILKKLFWHLLSKEKQKVFAFGPNCFYMKFLAFMTWIVQQLLHSVLLIFIMLVIFTILTALLTFDSQGDDHPNVSDNSLFFNDRDNFWGQFQSRVTGRYHWYVTWADVYFKRLINLQRVFVQPKMIQVNFYQMEADCLFKSHLFYMKGFWSF